MHLDTLSAKFHPGITASFGQMLAETAAICLESQNHQSGVSLQVDGQISVTCDLVWNQVTDQMRRCYADEEVATEHGAYGVAILLMRKFVHLKVIQRSRKGTGFDFWLGTKDHSGPYFQNKARLEVSGIRHGDAHDLGARVSAKLKQTTVSDESHLPVIVAVTEFGTPRTRVAKRC